MDDGQNEDWQLNRDVLECNKYMLENQINCDVKFTFPGEGRTISAHTYVLISRSPVFHAMFAGPAKDQGSGSQTIVIEDIDMECFMEMLR